MNLSPTCISLGQLIFSCVDIAWKAGQLSQRKAQQPASSLEKMPRRKGPPTLRSISLQYICDNLEWICYGINRRSPRFRQFVKRGEFLSMRSPLRHLPVHILTELTNEVLNQLGSAPHILHAVIQPQLMTCNLPPNISTLPLAIKLLVERAHSLSSFELTGCRVSLSFMLNT